MLTSTFGAPSKFSYLVAENEAGNPWEPLHVERGFAKEASTVTVIGAECPHNINDPEFAAALVAMQDEASFELAGKGFADTTRIAAGDGGLWRDILLDNRGNVLDGIERFQAQLNRLASALRANDGPAVKAWLDAAARRRERL